jgi:hypothetical protein
LALSNGKLSGDELFEGAPSAQFYSIRKHRESISRKPDLEHLETPPANVMHHSVFTDEYWLYFTPLDDDNAVTMDTAQHARAAATGPPAWPPRVARSECASNSHHDPFCGRFR